MPLAIELAAARVDALGVAQLLDRIDDRFALLVDGDRLAQQRQRSLAAAVQWSYELLDDRRAAGVPRGLGVPGTVHPGRGRGGGRAGAGQAVPRLVDCSLLVPPRAGPDGRTRYMMLETLRAYGAGLLAEAGEEDESPPRWPGTRLEVAEAGLRRAADRTGEAGPARQLDAEDTTMRHALAWAMEHDRGHRRCGWRSRWRQWWQLRGRLTSQAPLLAAAAEHAEPAATSGAPRSAARPGGAVLAEPAAALEHYTAVRDAVEDPGGRSPGAG